MIKMNTQGAILKGKGPDVVRTGLKTSKADIAKEATSLIHERLSVVLKHPTGRYKSSVVADLSSPDPKVLGDRKVYGSWLEGTSSRNHTTRFKGYKTFRLITQRIQRDTARIAEPSIKMMVKGLSR